MCVCACALSRLNRCSLSLQARLLGVPGQTAFLSGPIPASVRLQVRTVLGALGVLGGTMDLHSCTHCLASMQVTLLGRKNLTEAGLFPLLPRAWSRRGELAGELTPRTGPSVQTSGECRSLPHKWTGPGPNHMHWTERGEEEGRKKSRPKLPPLFPILCNSLISFRWEMGALSPREGGGASLPGRMRGEAAPSPFFPVAGPKSSFFVRKEGREDSLLKASPFVPLSPAPRRPVAAAWGQPRAGLPLSPQCLVFPRPLRPPCCGRVRAPGGG